MTFFWLLESGPSVGFPLGRSRTVGVAATAALFGGDVRLARRFPRLGGEVSPLRVELDVSGPASNPPSREILPMKRNSIPLLGLAVFVACTERPAVVEPEFPGAPGRSLASDANRTFVLNATLRTIDNPDICPNPGAGAVSGHVQVKLTRSIDNPEIHDWFVTGKILRPAEHNIVSGAVYVDGIVTESGPTFSAVFGIGSGAKTDPEGYATLTGAGTIGGVGAERMIRQPGEFTARFLSPNGFALCGRFVDSLAL